jgi:hypothetical protein
MHAFALRVGAALADNSKKVGSVKPARPTLERRKSRRECCRLNMVL